MSRRAFLLCLFVVAVIMSAWTPADAQNKFEITFDISVDTGATYSVLGVQQTTDGGFVTSGGGANYTPAFLLKLNPSGTVQFYKTYDISSTPSVQQTSDGGFILAGEQNLYDNPSLMNASR